MSEYIAHHGIKGMKWGVRNAETQAKYAGGNSSSGTLYKKVDRKRVIAAIGIGLAVVGGLAISSRSNYTKAGAQAVTKVVKEDWVTKTARQNQRNKARKQQRVRAVTRNLSSQTRKNLNASGVDPYKLDQMKLR